jgi:hypothetical protein
MIDTTHFLAFKPKNYSFIKKWILQKVKAPYDYKVQIKSKRDAWGRFTIEIHILNAPPYYHTQKFLFATLHQDKPIYISKVYSEKVTTDEFMQLLLNVDRFRKISLI